MDTYCPLVFLACDAHWQENVADYMARGYDHETACRLADEDEVRLLDQIEREETAAANDDD